MLFAGKWNCYQQLFKYRRVSIITLYKQNDYRCLSIRHIWIHSLSSSKRKNRSILKEISYEKVYRKGKLIRLVPKINMAIIIDANIVLLSCPLNYCDKNWLQWVFFVMCSWYVYIAKICSHCKNIFTYTITYLDNFDTECHFNIKNFEYILYFSKLATCLQ